jgi:hypothetical protein
MTTALCAAATCSAVSTRTDGLLARGPQRTGSSRFACFGLACWYDPLVSWCCRSNRHAWCAAARAWRSNGCHGTVVGPGGIGRDRPDVTFDCRLEAVDGASLLRLNPGRRSHRAASPHRDHAEPRAHDLQLKGHVRVYVPYNPQQPQDQSHTTSLTSAVFEFLARRTDGEWRFVLSVLSLLPRWLAIPRPSDLTFGAGDPGDRWADVPHCGVRDAFHVRTGGASGTGR